MRRAQSSLTRNLSLLLGLGFLVLAGNSQVAIPGDSKTLENLAGAKVIYGCFTAKASLPDAMIAVLRTVHTHFGEQPEIGDLLKSRDGKRLGVFFTVHAKSDGNKLAAGLAIVTATPDAIPEFALLFDDGDRFPSTEASLLNLLYSNGQFVEPVPSSGHAALEAADSSAPVEIPPMHPATGGDRSASICLPSDWAIVQVSAGSLTAKGPHNEIVALGFSQMVIAPNSVGGSQFARMPKFAGTPQAKFPDEKSVFTTYIDVLNQLRATRKLPPASFTLTSSRNFDTVGAKVRPLEVAYDLDLADGVGPRKGTARIDVLRTGNTPEWLLSISSSSVPIAYAPAEASTLRAIIRSFQVKEDSISIVRRGGPGGDPIQIRPGPDGFMRGEKGAPTDCAAISKPATAPLKWSEDDVKNLILAPPSIEGVEARVPASDAALLTKWLMNEHQGEFEVLQAAELLPSHDY